MTEEEIIQKITPVFRTVFKDPEINITRGLSADAVHYWTSLTNTLMIYEVEKAFGVKLGFREIIGLQNAGDLIDLVKSKLI